MQWLLTTMKITLAELGSDARSKLRRHEASTLRSQEPPNDVVDPEAPEAHEEANGPLKSAHARASFLEKLYKDHLERVMDDEDDDMQIEYHWTCALRCYLFFLVDNSIFMDKSATYVDVVYVKYFIELIVIHNYN
ncbi:unnamed protein product [Vicia faba]|uniref:Uncharacterized protein n=1 Tax=Vicia faba TaxID=3906 RepID=A0AAV1B6V2_VICFA|nr:unnamed protein product [Vicia faba]